MRTALRRLTAVALEEMSELLAEVALEIAPPRPQKPRPLTQAQIDARRELPWFGRVTWRD